MANFPGTAGDDMITGTADADTIGDGGGGQDNLNGGAGDDVITTTGGRDVVNGDDGVDRLIVDSSVFTGPSTFDNVSAGLIFNWEANGALVRFSGFEAYDYTGGNAVDTVRLSSGATVANLGGGNDIFQQLTGTFTLDAGSGFDTLSLEGSNGSVIDLIAGTVSNIRLTGSFTGIEAAIGSARADTLIAAANTVSLDGGNDNDVFDTSANTGSTQLTLRGGNGNDIYVIRAGANVVIAADTAAAVGTDRVETDIANYIIPAGVEDVEYFGSAAFTGTGNALDNYIVAGNLDDVLNGLDGADTLGGEAGSDVLNGGNGTDRLHGGAGADMMNGEAGNDRITVDDAGDIANGGEGIDTVEIIALIDGTYTVADDVEIVSNVSGSDNSFQLNALANTFGGSETGSDTVFGGAGQDSIYGRGGNDFLNGDAGTDYLFGNAGDDFLFGGDGLDILFGGEDRDFVLGEAGNDYLYGEAGDDLLLGGTGRDIMVGGAGADLFTYNEQDFVVQGGFEFFRESIADFSHAQGDKINLLFGNDGNAINFIGTAAFSGQAFQVRYTSITSTFAVVEADIDGNGLADLIINVSGAGSFTADDFGIISG